MADDGCVFCATAEPLDGIGGALVPIGYPFVVHQACLLRAYGDVIANMPPALLARYGLQKISSGDEPAE